MLLLEEILAESLCATGTRALTFSHMMSVLEAGHHAGLKLFTVDVETSDGSRPLPEWMFRLTDKEAAEMQTEQIVPAALEFYAANAADAELREAIFLVYFETAE
ncbi:hypothetical protein [Brevundimonas sp.]|uniref:hypothetical protein n=1 Tax=Brevundimonas sp. TaxID=1871086 RepID=UPI002638066C|nr:hypothetical protein [Brevundimonas sp.]